MNGSVNLTVTVPQVSEGQYVRYRIQGRESSNYGEPSNTVSLAGPPPLSSGGLSTAATWGIVGAVIALLIILLVIFLICYCCPAEARRKKRQAADTVNQIFKSKGKNKSATTVARYQPPSHPSWQSPDIHQEEDPAVLDHPAQVEIRFHGDDPLPASTRTSERIYFGQEDIERMRTGPRSATYSEK